MIAALYVETNGIYYGLPNVDPWDEQRDARLYDGPYPVVAHPPCKSWSIMGQCRPEIIRGEDGGCFKAALAAVRKFGGVLEHPANSHAWSRFHLPRPPWEGWARDLTDPGWVCHVDQRQYGHRAHKRTWLYYIGDPPPMLRWGTGSPSRVTVRNDGGGGRDQRSRTPIEFRDLLIELAYGALDYRKRIQVPLPCGCTAEWRELDLVIARVTGLRGQCRHRPNQHLKNAASSSREDTQTNRRVA